MTQTPENQQQYGSILTVLGENAEQNGKLQNKQITFTHIAIGDANDTYVQPDRSQTDLVNELARIPVNSVDVLQPTPDSVPMLKVEAILPDNVNDLVIREFAAVASFNDQTYFHAIGNCARIYVPPPVNNGNVLTPVTLEMIFVITSAEPIIEIDPNVVTASRDWVNQLYTRNIKSLELAVNENLANVESVLISSYSSLTDNGASTWNFSGVVDVAKARQIDLNTTSFYDTSGRQFVYSSDTLSPSALGLKKDGTDESGILNTSVKNALKLSLSRQGRTHIKDSLSVGYGRSVDFGNCRENGIDADYDLMSAIVVGDGAKVENLNLTKQTPEGKAKKGIGIDVTQHGAKWSRLSDDMVLGFDVGVHINSYYHNVRGLISHQNNIGLLIGNGITYAGAVTDIGSHYRQNIDAGIRVKAKTNQNWIQAGTFEFNRRHVAVEEGGQLNITGAYLGDPPEVVAVNHGSLSIDLQHNDPAVSGSTSWLSEAEDPTVNYPLSCIENYGFAALKNGQFGVQHQIRIYEGATASMKGAVLVGNGKYHLENFKLRTGTIGNDSLWPIELVDTQTIISGNVLKNYVHNGLFKQADAINNEHLGNASVSIVAGKVNPWGGSVIKTPRFGISINYTVPAEYIGKEMLLMVLTGEKFGTTAEGVDMNLSDLELNDSADYIHLNSWSFNMDDLKGYRMANTANGRCFAGMGRYVVRPTKKSGKIRLFLNSDGEAGREAEIAAVILQSMDSLISRVDITDGSIFFNEYPFGVYEDLEPKILEIV